MDRAVSATGAPEREPAPDLCPAFGLRLRRPVSRRRAAFDLIAQGMGGIMHVTGEPDGPADLGGLPICDLGTGNVGAQASCALYEAAAHAARDRRSSVAPRNGRGLSRGRARAGWPTKWSPPHGIAHRERALPAFRNEGRLHDDRRSAGHLGALRQGPGHPEWRTIALRRGPIAGSTASSSRRRSRRCWDGAHRHWIKALDDAGVPCGPVYNYEQLFSPTQVQHARWWSMPTTRSSDACRNIRTPIPHVLERRGCARDGAQARPAHGHDPRRLGYASADIDALHATRGLSF